jgi:hypothetical protein
MPDVKVRATLARVLRVWRVSSGPAGPACGWQATKERVGEDRKSSAAGGAPLPLSPPHPLPPSLLPSPPSFSLRCQLFAHHLLSSRPLPSSSCTALVLLPKPDADGHDPRSSTSVDAAHDEPQRKQQQQATSSSRHPRVCVCPCPAAASARGCQTHVCFF